MNRRQRRQSLVRGTPATTEVAVSIGRLTLEGVSPHVGRRIGESLQHGLRRGFEDAERLPNRPPEKGRGPAAALHSGPHDSPELVGDGLATLLTERLMP